MRTPWSAASAFLIICTLAMGCGTDERDFDLQGHRGARGLLPENSIPGFLRAVDLGVDTVELDIVVSGDTQLVVSHEPWMSASICSHPDGTPVTEEEEHDLNIFRMTYQEVEAFDCGSRGNPRFPTQEAMAVSKPLLRQVLDAVEARAAEQGRAIRYNIELKSSPDRDSLYLPTPDVFAGLLLGELATPPDILSRVTIQSFDPRALEAVHTMQPEATMALLVDNDDGLEANLARLTFSPAVYSPHYRLVDAPMVRDLHTADIGLVPWTVNEVVDMQRLLELEVDGIITDYPDRGATLKPEDAHQP